MTADRERIAKEIFEKWDANKRRCLEIADYILSLLAEAERKTKMEINK